MAPIPVNLAVEDELSEAILRRLLDEAGRFAIGQCHRKGGFGYLRSRIEAWNRAARWLPMIVLTDLDNKPCPGTLLASWLSEPYSPNLLLRVAVREVESWLIADRNGLAAFLSVHVKHLPPGPDQLSDPKQTLVQAAARSAKRDIRDGIAPRRNSTARQGPEYNERLGEFAQNAWNLNAARAASRSLDRSFLRLCSFRPKPEPF